MQSMEKLWKLELLPSLQARLNCFVKESLIQAHTNTQVKDDLCQTQAAQQAHAT